MPMPKIHKRATGNYYMSVTLAGKRKSLYGRTPDEVEQKYIRLMYEFGMGIKVGQKTLLSDYLRTWLSLKKGDISPYTYQGYKGNIENHIIPRIGQKTVQDILPADIQGLLVEKRKERKTVPAEKKKLTDAKALAAAAKTDKEKAAAKAALEAVDMQLAKTTPLSETSLLYIHRILTAAFNDAVANKMILVNPANGVKPPKRNKVKKRLPEEDTIQQLFVTVRGEEYELGVHLAVACGLRRGEICAVQWPDMDFDAGILHVIHAMTQTAEEGITVKPPKNDEPRDIFVPLGLMQLMKRIRRRQEADADIMGASYVKNDYMVKHRDGSYFTPYSMSMCINRAIKNLGITTTLHGLRGVYVSLGYKYGADEKAITDSAGHHSAEFNRERYQAVYDSMKADLAGKVDKALYPGDGE